MYACNIYQPIYPENHRCFVTVSSKHSRERFQLYNKLIVYMYAVYAHYEHLFCPLFVSRHDQ